MSHGVKYGVLAGLIGAAYTFLLQIVGLVTNVWMSVIAMLIWIGAIVLAHLSFRKSNQGVLGYGKGLSIGIVVAAISSLINSAYLYIHLTFISSEMLDYVIDNRALAYEQLGLGPEQIDQALAGWTNTIPGFVLLQLVSGLILGVILSLIIAAITRSKG